MKKYISVAALLAAGTAFASAAFTDGLVAYWNFDNSSSNYSSSTGFAGGVSTGLESGNFHVDGGLGNTGYISSHFVEGETTKNMDFYNNLSGMSIDTSSFTISFKVKGATADYRSLISFTIGSLGQVNLQTENPGNGNDTCLYGANIEMTEDSVRDSIKGSDGWANVVIYGDGTNITLNVNGYVASSAYTPVSGEKLSNLQLGSQWGDGTRRVDAKFDDFAIWNRALSTSEIAALANGTVFANGIAVPEPSAFGMLAGLGALALVAARRRRK
ncbi:MAG: PEP-CTERM sorting domain-containing protein [Opitutales bacterium]|nr:PEP-CTERM sorting domain-containing protein [Opitutales bacterium]